MAKPRGRRRDPETPLHRPKAIRPHLADEYEELENVQVAHELRRQLRGHADDLHDYLREQWEATRA